MVQGVLRRRTRLGAEGWYFLLVLLFLAVGAMLREINLLMVLFGLLTGALLFSWRTVVKTLRYLELRRLAPATAEAGTDLVVAIEARNTRRRGGAWSVRVEDSLLGVEGPAAGGGAVASVYFTHIRHGEHQRLEYRVRLPRRGIYRFGPLVASTGFPAGLWRRTEELDRPGTLTVFPRRGSLTARWAARQREASAGRRQVQRPLGLNEGEYHGLRDWRAGDSRRWIHWRTTARRGELMVRQFEQDRQRDLVVVLELREPAAGEAAEEALERAVSLAATLVSEQCRRGASQLTLVVCGRETAVLRGPASVSLEQEALRRLAVALPSADDRLPQALAEALTQVRGETDVVVVGHRPIDTSDSHRFARLWRDGRTRGWLGRMLTLDASATEIDAWYEP
jgi:uncharacterized protein (DUF58 family)